MRRPGKDLGRNILPDAWQKAPSDAERILGIAWQLRTEGAIFEAGSQNGQEGVKEPEGESPQ